MTDEEVNRLLRAYAVLCDGAARGKQFVREQIEAERALARRDPASLRRLFDRLAGPLLEHMHLGPELAPRFRVFLTLRAADLPRGTTIAERTSDWCIEFARMNGQANLANLPAETPGQVLRRAVVLHWASQSREMKSSHWLSHVLEHICQRPIGSWEDIQGLEAPCEYWEAGAADANTFVEWKAQVIHELQQETHELENILYGS